MAFQKQTTSTARPRRAFFIAILAIVLLAATGTGLELTHVTNFIHAKSASNPGGPTPAEQKEEAKTSTEQKKQAIENPVTATPSPTPQSDAISLSTRQESNGTVTVLTNLGAVANGTCTLEVTNGTATKSYTADVLYQAQYSTCAGFSVPVSDVGSGSWTLKLSVTSNGTTVSKSIQAAIT